MTPADAPVKINIPDFPLLLAFRDLVADGWRGASDETAVAKELAARLGRDRPDNVKRALRGLAETGLIAFGAAGADVPPRTLAVIAAMTGGPDGPGGGAGNPAVWDPRKLEPDPDQPRQVFDPGTIRALARDIAQNGLLQPILIRAHPDPDAHANGVRLIVAGERRWRAILELAADGERDEDAPVRVTHFDAEGPEAAPLAALSENLHRDDLNAMDVSDALARLRDDFAMTPARIAARIGKTPEYVQQHLRLQGLCEADRAALRAGALTFTDARARLARPRRPAAPAQPSGRESPPRAPDGPRESGDAQPPPEPPPSPPDGSGVGARDADGDANVEADGQGERERESGVDRDIRRGQCGGAERHFGYALTALKTALRAGAQGEEARHLETAILAAEAGASCCRDAAAAARAGRAADMEED